MTCALLVSWAVAGPAKAAKAKEESVEKSDSAEELQEGSEEDLVQEGGAHHGRYVGGRGKDYDEYYGEEDEYDGKAGHEKAHKAGASHSHHDHHEESK